VAELPGESPFWIVRPFPCLDSLSGGQSPWRLGADLLRARPVVSIEPSGEQTGACDASRAAHPARRVPW